MHELVRHLHQDHVQFNRLLNLLGRELDRFHTGDEPEFDLLIDLLDYIGNYADCVHHRTEDRLFEALLERTDEAKEAIEELMGQHRTLIALTRDFRHALEAITQDAVIRRDEVEQMGRDYIELQRRHLQIEERDIFGLINRELSDDDFAAIAAELPVAGDPLQDERVQERYRALYEYLLQEEEQKGG